MISARPYPPCGPRAQRFCHSHSSLHNVPRSMQMPGCAWQRGTRAFRHQASPLGGARPSFPPFLPRCRARPQRSVRGTLLAWSAPRPLLRRFRSAPRLATSAVCETLRHPFCLRHLWPQTLHMVLGIQMQVRLALARITIRAWTVHAPGTSAFLEGDGPGGVGLPTAAVHRSKCPFATAPPARGT
jgi:hypothetical protein